jgi:hypothetical protein
MTAAAVAPETEEPTTKAIVRRPNQVTLLRPIAPVAEVIVAQEEIRELIQKALKPGRDYGTIPGTKKPTLYKAGAERTANACGLEPRFRIVESEIDHDREVKYTKREKVWRNKHKGDKSFDWKESAGISFGLYRYVTECQLVSRETGEVVGSFMGVCSTMESKYVDRPRDCDNTALKMSEKRSLVGAVLVTLGLSDQFTQDVEDLPREVVQNGQSANAAGDVEEVVDAEIVKDLAWAMAYPLPWPKHKHFGQPIRTRSTKELEGALAWAVKKINDAGAEGRELGPTDMMVEFKEALALVVAHRNEETDRESARLEAAGIEGPAPKAESTSVPVPKPGKIADAIAPIDDPTSKNALYARVKKALESAAISPALRDDYARDNVNGFKRPGKPLAWWAEKLEAVAKKAAPAAAHVVDETFPQALVDSPDDDGLPF